MSISETIRAMRRKKDITQEELADMLHVTPQAVSRWENDNTAPDVNVIIKLTDIFGCTADELLGINSEKKKERIDYYRDITFKAGQHGDGDRAIKARRDVLEEYPGDLNLMIDLAGELNFFAGTYDKQKERDMLLESIKLCESVIARGGTANQMDKARLLLVYALYYSGSTDRAREYACEMPTIYYTRDFVMTRVGEDKNMEFINLYRTGYSLMEEALEFLISKRTSKFNVAERAELADKWQSLRDIVYDRDDKREGDGVYRQTLLAEAYVNAGENAKALLHLREAAENALFCDEVDYNAGYKSKINSLPMRSDSDIYTCITTSCKNSYVDDLLSGLNETVYDPIRGTPEFADILKMLKHE